MSLLLEQEWRLETWVRFLAAQRNKNGSPESANLFLPLGFVLLLTLLLDTTDETPRK